MSIPEAPFDGEAHARKEGAWVLAYGRTALDSFVELCRSFFSGCEYYYNEVKRMYDEIMGRGFVEDVPDNKQYVRTKGGWLPATIPSTGGGSGEKLLVYYPAGVPSNPPDDPGYNLFDPVNNIYTLVNFVDADEFSYDGMNKYTCIVEGGWESFRVHGPNYKDPAIIGKHRMAFTVTAPKVATDQYKPIHTLDFKRDNFMLRVDLYDDIISIVMTGTDTGGYIRLKDIHYDINLYAGGIKFTMDIDTTLGTFELKVAAVGGQAIGQYKLDLYHPDTSFENWTALAATRNLIAQGVWMDFSFTQYFESWIVFHCLPGSKEANGGGESGIHTLDLAAYPDITHFWIEPTPLGEDGDHEMLVISFPFVQPDEERVIKLTVSPRWNVSEGDGYIRARVSILPAYDQATDTRDTFAVASDLGSSNQGALNLRHTYQALAHNGQWQVLDADMA